MPKPCSYTAAERELYRYYQPDISCNNPDQNGAHVARSSCDPCMTAFAQLGALRLNARRGIISLSVKDTEYILAEAGRTLSLQEDDDEHDSLWHGVGALNKNEGLGPNLVEYFRGTAASHLVINDLTKHPKLKDNVIVTGTPFLRFLACVPLRAPYKSTIIGTFIVVDDVPRDRLNEDELRYLMDLGTTVMEYLEAGRTKRKHSGAERMVKALGLFVEGKDSLRDWWLGGGHHLQDSRVNRSKRNGISLESRADIEFGVREPEDRNSVQGIERLNQRRSRNPNPSVSSTMPSTYNQSEKEQSGSTVNTTIESEPIDLDPQSDSSASETPKKLQEALVSSDVKDVFARASNLIREALAVEGVVFYDASVGSFGGRSRKDGIDEKAPGEFLVEEASNQDTSSSEENPKPRAHGVGVGIPFNSPPHNSQDLVQKNCNILGYSTRSRSSLRAHFPSDGLRAFPEKIMRRLLKKYPHGKVFNFDEGGSVSSDSDGALTETDGQFSPAPEVKARRTKDRMSKEAEAAAILSVVPGARSVYWFPLWNQAKERWYAGSLVWSSVATRSLCPVEDLTYMAAFGNSVMAEVSRLSALVAAQMKSDFISSISHELRSPLHGVLASVEFLQETTMTEMQTDMVNNISASGKVLLDTINHVLDFSNVNKRSKERPKRSRRKGRRRSKEPSRERKDEATEDIEDIRVISAEVINSVYAGRNVGKLAQEVSGDRLTRSKSIRTMRSPVTVILDIVYRPHWMFEVDAGAWRRILMNLFSNALKYTDTGFVKVTLKIEDELSSQNRKPRSNLFLKVSDSGKGISQEFLKHQLFKPFSQEDSLAVGTGLGLSIVRQIVHNMGGDIYLTSEQGTGTEAIVRLPLIPSPPSSMSEGHGNLVELRNATKGLKASFFGFDRYPEISETPTGILSPDTQGVMLLKASIKSMMLDWFLIEEATGSPSDNSMADLEIIMEAGMDEEALSQRITASRTARAAARRMIIVLCNKFVRRTTSDSKDFKVVYLQQPYGPLKFANALYTYTGFGKEQQFIETHGGTSSIFEANSQDVNSFKASQPSHRGSELDTTPTTMSGPKSPPSVGMEPREALNDASPSKRENSTENAASSTDRIRVLLVEDNAINLKLLVMYMRKLNIDHVTAMNGLEALNAYKDARGKFDIVFMDISMPVMSGIESTRHIRGYEEEESLKPVTLIALTGAANPAARQEAYACGVDVFLTKPVPMKDLKKMVEDLKTKGREGLDR